MHIIILCIGNGLNPDKTLFWNKGKSMLCGYLILRGGHIDNVGSKRSWKVFVQSRNWEPNSFITNFVMNFEVSIVCKVSFNCFSVFLPFTAVSNFSAMSWYLSESWIWPFHTPVFFFSLQHLSSFTLKTAQEAQVPPRERLKQTKVWYSALYNHVFSWH